MGEIYPLKENNMSKLDFLSEARLVRRSSYKYIFPPMIGMVFAQLAPVIDGICVSGRMGEEALSAIGIIGPLDYVFNIISALCGIGCGVVISRYSGAGEKTKAARVFTRTLIALLIATFILTALCIVFADPLLKLLSATPENYGYAKEYLIITSLGSVFMVLNFAGDYILANDNNETLAMAGDIVGAVVNIIIDYVGVYVFNCGIWIVALGTVLGSVCCCGVYMLHFKKKDRLCRVVSPKRQEGDPSFFETVKPGSAEAVMYLFFVIQLLLQNFVLREQGGTSGLGNSTIIENLTLVFTIIIAGYADAIYPMASAYHGEQNKCGMLMVKRSVTRTGFIVVCVPVVLLCVFPQLTILPYKVNDPLMLETLPFAVRLISLIQLISFLDTVLINYLSATEQEVKANIAIVIQLAVQIPMILLLNDIFGMNAPWYATLLAQTAVLVYLCVFCKGLPKGMRGFHKENLLLLKGGKLNTLLVSDFEKAVSEVLCPKEFEMLKNRLTEPLCKVLNENFAPYCCFNVLKREDDKHSVILHYRAKKDIIEDLTEIDEDDEDSENEVPENTCLRSEFLGMRRLMIILKDV